VAVVQSVLLSWMQVHAAQLPFPSQQLPLPQGVPAAAGPHVPFAVQVWQVPLQSALLQHSAQVPLLQHF